MSGLATKIKTLQPFLPPCGVAVVNSVAVVAVVVLLGGVKLNLFFAPV